jgi:drug/metabolite transporter (DMT)-like permease
VCIIWGTTYLGIRIALESFSPEMLLFLRYTVSGGLMLAGATLAGAHIPRGSELFRTALFGVVTIGIGNGCLSFAEEWIPSGLAALFVATSPFWLVGIEALAPRGERLHLPAVRGMLVGAVGVILLVAPAIADFHANPAVLGAFLLLQLGCAGWALGSIGQRKTPVRAHPFISGAVQQFATGIVYAFPALFHRQPIHWSARGIAAVVYLMMFGSVIGYSSYILAMRRLPVSIASIYTYVNPIIAVLVGWLAYRESVGWREAAAMAVIFTGIAMVKRAVV